MPDFPGTVNFPTSRDTAVSLIEAPLLPASTTLSADINTSALSIPLASVANLSASGIATLVDSLTAPTKLEKVAFTSISGSSLVIPSGGRGVYGTTAQTWTASPTTYVLQYVGGEHHNKLAAALIAVEGALDDSLISVVWGTPGAESGNAIEVAATCVGIAGTAFASAVVELKITVTDGAADREPSHTATITAADTPVGTITGGSGTATVLVQTNSSGAFKVKVSETTAGSRYLIVGPGGHSRIYPRSTVGVLQLTFA